MEEVKKNQDMYKPLSKESEERLKDLIYEDNFHFGRDKTYDAFKRKYPNDKTSRRAIWSYLEKQEIHQLTTRPVMSRNIVRPIIATKLGSIQLDYLDMSSQPYNGFKYILNAVDIFSKKYYAFPCKEATVESTKKGLEQFFAEGMKASYIQSDNGGHFRGDLPEWLSEKGTKHGYSRPHVPQSNAVIESSGGYFKKSLFQAMRAKVTADWVSLTPKIVSNINNTMRFSTGKSPNDIERDSSTHAGVAEMILSKASRRYKNKTLAADLQVGDYVRYRLEYDSANIRKASKEGYWRPDRYEVTAVVKSKNPNITSSYRIKNLKSGEPVRGLIPRGELMGVPKDLDEAPEVIIRPPPVNPEAPRERQEYEIESIIDKRVTRRTRGTPQRVEYLVKWKGWAHRSNTWETRANLMRNARQVLLDYEQSND